MEGDAVAATVTDAGQFEKLVRFVIPEGEIESAKSKAARRLSRDMKIRGFRPGKAPRPVVEAAVGAERLRAEAIDDALPVLLADILGDLELDPAVSPSLESMEEGSDGVDVEVRVTMWPELDATPEVSNRTVEVGNPEVSDEELSEQIGRLRSQYAELEAKSGEAGSNDFLTIDLAASKDGVEIPEASASEVMYQIGSGGLVDGIDDALLGAESGQVVTFEGQLPPGFGEMAGEEVTFRVTVNDIQAQRLPDLTDEWVSEVTEFSSVDELEVNLETRMADMKRQSLAGEFRNKALDQLVDEVEIEVPEAIVRSEMDEVLHRFVHRLESQGLALDDYFAASNLPREQFVDDLRNQSERSVRTRLLLESVAADQGLEVPDEELELLIEQLVAQSEDPAQARRTLAEGPPKKSLVGDILRNKALELIISSATPVDETGEPVDLRSGAEMQEPSIEGEDDVPAGIALPEGADAASAEEIPAVTAEVVTETEHPTDLEEE